VIAHHQSKGPWISTKAPVPVECPKRYHSEPIAHALFPPGTSAGSHKGYDPIEFWHHGTRKKTRLICALFSQKPFLCKSFSV
jgi:hypothetical protein